MSPTRLLPAALLAVALPLAGCAAGQNDTTSHERTTPYTADASLGAVQVRNVVITPSSSADASSSASPTPSPSDSSTSAAGSQQSAQAYLSLTVASSTEDRLSGATVSGGGTVTPTSGADLTVRPQQLLMVVDPQSGGDASKPSLEISGLAQPPVVGTTMTVTLTFENAGTVTVQAPVRDVAPA